MAKVLVVEDNSLNLKLLRDLLAIKHHDVEFSTDGVGIVEIVRNAQYDLIFMDIQLGKNSGIDIIKNLKADEQTLHIPIIAVTAFAMRKEATEIIAAGCDRYLTKPLVINEFYEVLDQYTATIN